MKANRETTRTGSIIRCDMLKSRDRNEMDYELIVVCLLEICIRNTQDLFVSIRNKTAMLLLQSANLF